MTFFSKCYKIFFAWWCVGLSGNGYDETLSQSLSHRTFHTLAAFRLGPAKIFTSYLRSVSLWLQVSRTSWIGFPQIAHRRRGGSLKNQPRWLSPVPSTTHDQQPTDLFQSSLCSLVVFSFQTRGIFAHFMRSLLHYWVNARFPFHHCQRLRTPNLTWCASKCIQLKPKKKCEVGRREKTWLCVYSRYAYPLIHFSLVLVSNVHRVQTNSANTQALEGSCGERIQRFNKRSCLHSDIRLDEH